ncbi:MAG: hypothetical protein JWM68_3361 [Verrucomicrobiales bacterium]|nr:hypothetical protein [Verrucomicrobiales bacterium]
MPWPNLKWKPTGINIAQRSWIVWKVRAFGRGFWHGFVTPMKRRYSFFCRALAKLFQRRFVFNQVGLALILVGSAVFTARANSIAALSFDGMDDVIEISSPPVLGSKFTEEAWILPDPKDDRYHGILGSNPSKMENRAPGMWIKSRTVLHATFGTGSHFVTVESAPDVLLLNFWNHVAATYDGTTYRLFVNGAEVAAEATKQVPVAQPVMRIGRVNYWFPGAIREVRLWNRALSGDEIRGQMNKQLSGTEPGLVGYFRLDDGAGDRAKNSVPHGGEGTLLNGPTWITSAAPIAPALLNASLLEKRPGGVEAFLPTGDNAPPDAPIEIRLRESAGEVDPTLIRLTLDNRVVETMVTTNDAGGLLIRYEHHELLEAASTHTVKLSYVVKGSAAQTNDLSYDFSITPNIILSK